MAIVLWQKIKIRWSPSNKKHFESYGYEYTKRNDEIEVNVSELSEGSPQQVKFQCDYCGEIYDAKYKSLHKNKNQFCSRECKCKWNSAHPRTQYKAKCGNCGEKVTVVPSKIKKSSSGMVFCSNKCVGEYNSTRHKENRVHKECLICGDPYDVKPSEAPTSVTCSTECQHKWQSKYRVGENSANFNHNYPIESRLYNCDYCGEELQFKNLDRIENKQNEDKHYFCSKECFQKWYATDWSQREEWKLESRERTVKMLSDGVFNHTDTEPQIKIDNLLTSLEVKYENEYNCKYFAVDNYLSEYNLMIEINGTYWHADPRRYDEINYQNQVDRIKSDKAKHSYIINNYNVEILYLWEEDVNSNIELCEKLILEYIDNNGRLENYQSFNYYLDESGNLQLKEEITVPYMEYDIEELRKIINISESKRRSMKQLDKWITFNCEYCGEEKEQLKSKYNKSKHHYCSGKCSANGRKTRKKSSNQSI